MSWIDACRWKGRRMHEEYDVQALTDDLRSKEEMDPDQRSSSKPPKDISQTGSRSAWLLTWNRANWSWEDYRDTCQATKAGIPFKDSWSCSSTSPIVGDEVFLIKLGKQPRGLVGHGVVRRESYVTAHYDPEQAAEGKTRRCIDVEFDQLLDYEREDIVTQEVLKDSCGAQNWSPMASGIRMRPEVLPTVHSLWKAAVEPALTHGFDEIVSFLSDYSGARYVAPQKAGDQAEGMLRMRERGQEARKRFAAFGQMVAERVSGLEYVSCSNWLNQGQVVPRYLWIQLKRREWDGYPQSVSMNVEPHDAMYPGEGYYLSVRAETRDAGSTRQDYRRQFRLLDCSLRPGMTYRAKYADQTYHYLGTDTELARSQCMDGTIEKLTVIEAVEDLVGKDAAGTVLAETARAVGEILPLYEYVMEGDGFVTEPEGEEEMTSKVIARNTILYGPPGTGKTYNSVVWAVAICEGKSPEEVAREEYPDVHERYEALREEGRIVFTTFHQSYGYEEFIEGIRPVMEEDDAGGAIRYEIRDGVFKSLCKAAGMVKVREPDGTATNEQPRIWGMILGGTGMTDLKRECFEDGEIRLGWSEIKDGDATAESDNSDTSSAGRHMVNCFKDEMGIGDFVLIEKTNRSIDAICVVTGEYCYDQSRGRYPRSRRVEWLAKDIDQDMIQFLPEGRKQLARHSLFPLDYVGMDNVSAILRSCPDARPVSVDQESRPHVLVIDEINRGNVSKVFGELITLIEDTKRTGAAEEMEAVLPYSGESFSVPQNVYILGTMNTADRSIALMDTALRRRFDFVEMMPDSAVLRAIGADKVVDGDEAVDVAAMLDVINARIECLYDREHTIGHAFFTRLRDDSTLEALADIFRRNVIPLLQEYFYEDWEKVQLVLGDNAKEDEYKFVLDEPLKVKTVFRGSPDIDLPERCYRIQPEAFLKLESYKQIGEGL